MRNPESGQFFLWNPEPKFRGQKIRNPVSLNQRLSLIPLYGATIECVSFEVGNVCGSLGWAAKNKLDCSQCSCICSYPDLEIKDREITFT